MCFEQRIRLYQTISYVSTTISLLTVIIVGILTVFIFQFSAFNHNITCEELKKFKVQHTDCYIPLRINPLCTCTQGPPGISGIPGQKGLPGNDGMPGLNGKPGRCRSKYFPYGNCSVGEPGDPGEPGHQGLPGQKGKIGDDGECKLGNKGSDGDKGPDGIKGEKGMNGEKGYKGFIDVGNIYATPGPKGQEGRPGPIGHPGYKGIKGIVGRKGHKGIVGDKGRSGDMFTIPRKGDKGDPGKNKYCNCD